MCPKKRCRSHLVAKMWIPTSAKTNETQKNLTCGSKRSLGFNTMALKCSEQVVLTMENTTHSLLMPNIFKNILKTSLCSPVIWIVITYWVCPIKTLTNPSNFKRAVLNSNQWGHNPKDHSDILINEAIIQKITLTLSLKMLWIFKKFNFIH